MKLVDENEHQLTLQHPDGHKVVMAKGALSKQTIDKIKKFSSGGEVNYGVSKDNTIDPDKAQAFKSGFNGQSQQSNPKLQQSQVSNPQPQPVAHMADGGDPGLLNQAGQALGHYGVQPLVDAGKNIWNSYSNAVNSVVDKVGSGISDFASGVLNPDQNPQAQAPETPQAVPASMTEQAPAGPQNVSLNVPSTANDATAPMMSAAYAPQYKQAVQQNINAYQQNANQQEQLANDFQTNFQALNQEHEKFKQDLMNGHIDPNRIFNDQSIGQKVSTAVGLLLGGLGGGLTHQENPVMKFINSQIDRDIDAQKTQLGKNTTLLEDNLRQTGNLDQATNLTRLQHLAALESKLGPGTLQMQTAPIMQQMAMQQALYKNMQSGGGGVNNPQMGALAVRALVPEKQQEAAFTELKGLQGMQKIGTNVLDSFDKVSNMVLGGAFSPHQRDAETEPVLAQMVKESEGRITPTDIPMIRALFPSTLDGAGTRDLKRNKLIKFLSEKMNSPLLQSFGISLPSFSTGKPVPVGAGFKQAGYQQ